MTDPTPPVPVGSLLFVDHFDGVANTLPDSTKWGFESHATGFAGRNGELQYYTDADLDNAFVDGASNLHIVCRAESIGGKAYSSASILTDGKFAWTTGYIEFRAQIPAGSGIWPALWSVGAGTWPGTGEIDVMEAVNSDALTTSNVHGGPTHWSNYGQTAIVRSPAAFHVFGANVLSDRIVFYLDGVAYHTVLASSIPAGQTWPFNTSAQDIRINVAMGGSFPGTPDGSAALPLTMLVDYVKVWAPPSGSFTTGGTLGLTATVTASGTVVGSAPAPPTPPTTPQPSDLQPKATSMLTVKTDVDRGLVTLSGITPNGNAIVTRTTSGLGSVLLRGGARVVSTGGIDLDDTEAPLSVPLTYSVAMSGILLLDRIYQQNLALTPTFLHGVQGWLAGSGAGRSLVIEADPTAHSASVGHFIGSTAGVAAPAVPTLVGHVDSAVLTDSNYTLQPPVTGGTAIAVGDWMLLVHQQNTSATVSAPVPVGVSTWTLVDDTTDGGVRQLIWSRKRDSNDQTGNIGYQVAVTAGAKAIGTLLWIRGATQDQIVKSPVTIASGTRNQLLTSTASVSRPHLTLSFLSASTTGTVPSALTTTGGTFQYVRNSIGQPRTLTVVSDPGPSASDTRQVVIDYGAVVPDGVAVQLSLQVSASLTNRIIARGKLAAIPAATQPYVLTGRLRYNTVDLNDWQDIKTFGTWQQVKTTKGTWLATRGAASTLGGRFLSLFMSIVDPATGADYVTPVQLYSIGEARLNTWLDFSAYFSTAVAIPATAELRLYHGTNVAEYATDVWLDEIGVTPGAQFFTHSTLPWFDGDTPLPAEPTFYSWPGWTKVSSDAAITWLGTVGNSVSQFAGPSAITAVMETQLNQWSTLQHIPCEPVMLSDPVNVNFVMWVGLIHIDALTHPSKQAIHQIINRADPIAISQKRGWETGTVTVLTMDMDQRAKFLSVIRSGRVLLLRNPNRWYPENDWYLALGDITEDRPVPNQRVTIREWTLPFVRIARPAGLIEASAANTWASVKDQGTWGDVRFNRQDWLYVLTGEPVG